MIACSNPLVSPPYTAHPSLSTKEKEKNQCKKKKTININIRRRSAKVTYSISCGALGVSLLDGIERTGNA